MPRFSVVIPAYNAIRTIEDTIRSVLAQSEGDFELIVVDDGSSDGTAELVASFESDSRVSLIQQDNRGTAAARNTAIARASADYVSFLDHDDLWMPGYLAQMGTALDAHPEAGFAYCDAWGLDDVTRRVHGFTEMHYRPPPPPGADRDQILIALARDNFVMSSATVRRRVLEQLGGYDATVRGTEDYDLWLRVLLSGHTAVQAGREPLLLQRGHHLNQSKDERMMHDNLRLVLRRAAESERMAPVARQIALRRAAALDRDLVARDSDNPLRRALHSLPGLAVAVRNRLRRNHYWPAEPPPEVAEAFPELCGTRSRSAGRRGRRK